MSEERTGFGPRRPRMSWGAAQPAATTPELLRFFAARVRPAGPARVRPTVLAGSSGVAHLCQGLCGSRWGALGGAHPCHPYALLIPLGGLGSSRTWRLSQSPTLALFVCAKGPGQPPGGGGAGTAAIQVAGVHLQLRGTHLGRKVRPLWQTRFGFIFLPKEISLTALCRSGCPGTPEILLPLHPERWE